MKLQVTLFDSDNKHKPISTIVEVESMEYYENNKKKVQKRALENLCAARYVGPRWIVDNHYNKIAVRIYNPTLIKAHNKARYQQIKKERGWV